VTSDGQTWLARSPQSKAEIMTGIFARWVLLAIALAPSAASAELIKLKLSLISSDRSLIYLGVVKPFVDAVNAEAKGLLEIEIYFSGAMGKSATQQPQLVADGMADIAYIRPGYTPDRFYNNTIVELPGLFENPREASLVYTRLIADSAIKGYEEYFVIAALMSPPENIQSRRPIASIADLKGLAVRVNNPTEAAVLERLGMRPIPMAVDLTSEAISSQEIDAATVPAAMLFEFGIGRVASYHYLLDIGCAPLAVVMNRKKFESLPEQARNIIRKYSGEWPIIHYLAAYEEAGNQVMKQLEANSRRKVVYPSSADLGTAHLVFKSVIDEWVARSPRNLEQFRTVEAEIAQLRAAR
jgi:TRAP-type C4-dicarboxylate transport system substrate-binding protein